MAYHLPKKMKNNKIGIKTPKGPKLSKTGIERLPTHLSSPHFKNISWIRMENIKLKKKSIN